MSHTDSKFRAVLFDWAGTTVDYGSRAPTAVFLKIFRRRGIEITEAEARGPMGMAKHDHIAAVAALPRVAAAWSSAHGSVPNSDDVTTMYEEFLPLQLETLAQGCDLIPGVLETVAECRRRGLKIGSTTGYTRALMEVVRPAAASAGYAPDVTVCSDDVTAGRPAPWMNFRAAELLRVYPLQSILVVDDTPVGIEAGRHAGCVTVAVSQTGNALGLSAAEVACLSAADLDARLTPIEAEFRRIGADYVLRSVADLAQVLNRDLAR